MNKTPRSVRPHIVIMGKCNAGKSTLINSMCGQRVAVVSKQAGTTTDPVYKSMELLPFGPVVLVDTAGLDDTSTLGQERIKATWRAVRKADYAIMVVQGEPDELEIQALEKLQRRKVETLVVENRTNPLDTSDSPFFAVNALTGERIQELKDLVSTRLSDLNDDQPLVSDLLTGEGAVVLVTPIDRAAPKGRLILPQVQTLRDVIDAGKIGVVCRETELSDTLRHLQQEPQLVITDSQVFKQVDETLPDSIPLTSFSILMARYKGNLTQLWAGVQAIKNLKPGDKVLVAEACTHHRQEDDIGTVKIPRLLNAKIGGELAYSWASGSNIPDNISKYKLIIHCGGCMINRKEMLARLSDAEDAGVPIVNYGILLAYVHGILERSLEPLQHVI